METLKERANVSFKLSTSRNKRSDKTYAYSSSPTTRPTNVCANGVLAGAMYEPTNFIYWSVKLFKKMLFWFPVLTKSDYATNLSIKKEKERERKSYAIQ